MSTNFCSFFLGGLVSLILGEVVVLWQAKEIELVYRQSLQINIFFKIKKHDFQCKLMDSAIKK